MLEEPRRSVHNEKIEEISRLMEKHGRKVVADNLVPIAVLTHKIGFGTQKDNVLAETLIRKIVATHAETVLGTAPYAALLGKNHGALVSALDGREKAIAKLRELLEEFSQLKTMIADKLTRSPPHEWRRARAFWQNAVNNHNDLAHEMITKLIRMA